MILYQDADSIAKLYLNDELGIEETRRAVDAADVVASSLLSYAEVRATLAAAHRGRRFQSNSEYTRVSADFEEDWNSYIQINVSIELVKRAGDLAENHNLRGYDSVHLASLIALRQRVPDEIHFSTWDTRLKTAAANEGFPLAHEADN